MATFSKTILSGSTDGRAIKVVATTSPGTTIHTGSASASTLEEVWMYASNPDSSAHTVTVQWGGTSSPDDYIVTYLPANSGLVLISPGLPIKGNATPLVVKAFADSANKVTILGYVNALA